MNKVALIVGHNPKKQGSFSSYFKLTEYAFNTDVANIIRKHFQAADNNLDCEVFYRESYYNDYTAEIADVYTRASNWLGDNKNNLIIELHFNSYDTSSANGAEVLVASKGYENVDGIAEIFLKHLEKLGLRNRGIKFVSKSQNGGGGLSIVPSRSILLEPFFASHYNDCVKIKSAENLAKVYIDALYAVYNLEVGKNSDTYLVDVQEHDWLNLRAEPNYESVKTGQLGRLTLVKKEGEKNGWFNVSINGMKLGFVNPKYLKRTL